MAANTNNFFHNLYKKNQNITKNTKIENTEIVENQKNNSNIPNNIPKKNNENINNNNSAEIIKEDQKNNKNIQNFNFSSFDFSNDLSKNSNNKNNSKNETIKSSEKIVKPFAFTKISRDELMKDELTGRKINEKNMKNENNDKKINDVQFDQNSLNEFKNGIKNNSVNNSDSNELHKNNIAQNTTKKNISKVKASAIYLISIGVDKASLVVKQFSDEEKSKLFKEIAKIDKITEEDYIQTEKLFGNMPVDYQKIANGKEFLRELMLKLYGINDGSVKFIKIAEEAEKDNFEYINKLDSEQFLELMANEADYMYAAILSLLDTKKASEIIKKLPPEKAASILKMMSGKLNINNETFKIIVEKLNEKAKDMIKNSYLRIQGKKKLIEIIKNADIDEAEEIINKIEKEDKKLADELRENIFTFTDVLKLDKKELEKVLKDYENKEIAYILKGADENIKTIFLTCVSKKRRELIEDEILNIGPVKKSEVEEKRKEFAKNVKKLIDQGIIFFSNGKDEYIY